MKSFDAQTIEKRFFKSHNPIRQLLKVSLDLFQARQTGILYGTNDTKIKFLPTSMWDRGIMDKFYGKGLLGIILRLFGTYIVTARKLSPVHLFKTGKDGKLEENDGIISYVLRTFSDYYKKGISVIICPDTDKIVFPEDQKYMQIPFFSYNGYQIEKPSKGIKVDTRIVKHFKSSNSIYIYLPDYGILVINTADVHLMETRNETFVREKELKRRLDILIKLVEASSLAYLGQLKGKRGAQLLWRKEQHLRQTSHALVENERRYRDLYENAPIAYLSLAPDGSIIKCNRRAEILSGYDRTDLLGRNAASFFFSPSEGETHVAGIRERLDRGEAIRDMELKIKSGTGNLIWVSLSVDAVRNQSGQIDELRAMIMDISQRKGLEKQLVQAQKMEAIGTLAGGIAHDFNNLLSPISGYTEMLLMETPKESPAREHLDIILDCASLARDLVSQLLTFSRQKERQLRPLDPGSVVREAMLLVRSFIPSTIKINTDIEADCGYILADPVQMSQVIMNLATNAYHAMEGDTGTIDIALKRKSPSGRLLPGPALENTDYICLTVGDSGAGIDPLHLDKIFDPYFTTKSEGKGSGIGLSVVHGIVKSHNGYIRVKSEKDKGTRFDIYFPVLAHPGDIDTVASSEDALPTGKEKVLLVDDEKKVAVMETHMLEKLGYTVTCFTSSLNAAAVFKSNPNLFDVVVTDLTMPDMTGPELAEQVRAVNPTIPVILCTGFGESLEAEMQERLPVKGVIKKPLTIRALANTIRRVLDD